MRFALQCIALRIAAAFLCNALHKKVGDFSNIYAIRNFFTLLFLIKAFVFKQLKRM